jgi:hypothetical protein
MSKKKKELPALYSEIEYAIISWNIDGTKTAGSLTRKLFKILQKNNAYMSKEEVKKLLENMKANDDGFASSIAEHSWNEVWDKKIQKQIEAL